MSVPPRGDPVAVEQLAVAYGILVDSEFSIDCPLSEVPMMCICCNRFHAQVGSLTDMDKWQVVTVSQCKGFLQFS